MKTLLLLIVSFLMLVGCSKPSSEEPTPQPSTPTRPEFKKYADDDEIKIMSFNIRNASPTTDPANEWDNRKAACIELLKDQKPTIIGFQEPQYDPQWIYLKEQMKDNYNAIGVSRITGGETGRG